jgi:hypothetical protein
MNGSSSCSATGEDGGVVPLPFQIETRIVRLKQEKPSWGPGIGSQVAEARGHNSLP